MQPVTIRSYEFHCNFVTSASVVVTRAKPLIAARWFAARSLMKDKMSTNTYILHMCILYAYIYYMYLHMHTYSCLYVYICVYIYISVFWHGFECKDLHAHVLVHILFL